MRDQQLVARALRASLTDDAWTRFGEALTSSAPGRTLCVDAGGSASFRDVGSDAPALLSERPLLRDLPPDLDALAAGLGDVRGQKLLFIGCGSGDEVRAAVRAGATALVIEVDEDRVLGAADGTEVRRARTASEALDLLADGAGVVTWVANAVAALPEVLRLGYAPGGVVDLARDAVVPNGYPPRAAEILARVNPLEYTRLLLLNRIELGRARRPLDERGVPGLAVPHAARRGAFALGDDSGDEAWLARAHAASASEFDSAAVNAAVANGHLAGPVALAVIRAEHSVVQAAADAARGAVYVDARGGSVVIADGTDAATARIKRWTSDNC